MWDEAHWSGDEVDRARDEPERYARALYPDLSTPTRT